MTLSEKILSLRTARGMSQDDLAEQLEVSRQSVSKWETGQSTPDLDKIIRLADLFGVTVDELVRSGEVPRPPEPPQKPPEPQVVYVEGGRDLTDTQKAGIVMAAAGLILLLIGLAGAGLLVLIGPVVIIASLPLILAKKHPWLTEGWLLVGLSLLIFNPYVAVAPWGLIGGLQRLYLYITIPEIRYPSTIFAIAVGLIRGTLVLVLAYFTARAWKKARKNKKSPEKDG